MTRSNPKGLDDMKRLWMLILIVFVMVGNVVIVAKAATNQITVSTNNKEYKPGDSVSIIGEIKQDGTAIGNVDVTYRLEYAGSTLLVDQTKATHTGFSAIFGLAKDAELGDYKVVVQALGETKEVMFKVTNSATTAITSTTTTSKTIKTKFKVYTYKNPVVIKGEVMIPYSPLLKDLGTTYKYDKKKYTISAKKNKISLVLTLKKASVRLGGQTKQISVAPVIKNGKVLIPATYVSKSFGAKVDWDKKKKIYKVSVPDK